MLKHNFTLIELLLVIAIIGILSSLLLSFLSSARQRARTSGCLNNIRQVGIAYSNYCDDFAYTPPVWNNGRWFNKLSGYIESSYGEGNLWRCPADFRVEAELSYGINQTVCRNPESRKKEDLLWYGLPVGRIKDPSAFITIADSSKYYIGKDADGRGEEIVREQENVISGGVYSYLALRHNHGFNAAFADTHVEYIAYRSMPTVFWDYNGDAYEDFN